MNGNECECACDVLHMSCASADVDVLGLQITKFVCDLKGQRTSFAWKFLVLLEQQYSFFSDVSRKPCSMRECQLISDTALRNATPRCQGRKKGDIGHTCNKGAAVSPRLNTSWYFLLNIFACTTNGGNEIVQTQIVGKHHRFVLLRSNPMLIWFFSLQTFQHLSVLLEHVALGCRIGAAECFDKPPTAASYHRIMPHLPDLAIAPFETLCIKWTELLVCWLYEGVKSELWRPHTTNVIRFLNSILRSLLNHHRSCYTNLEWGTFKPLQNYSSLPLSIHSQMPKVARSLQVRFIDPLNACSSCT